MIALIENQFYDFTPVPAPEGEWKLLLDEDNTIKLYKGDKRIEYGPKYILRAGNGKIDAITGKLEQKGPGNFEIRVIFGGTHVDFEAVLS